MKIVDATAEEKPPLSSEPGSAGALWLRGVVANKVHREVRGRSHKTANLQLHRTACRSLKIEPAKMDLTSTNRKGGLRQIYR